MPYLASFLCRPSRVDADRPAERGLPGAPAGRGSGHSRRGAAQQVAPPLRKRDRGKMTAARIDPVAAPHPENRSLLLPVLPLDEVCLLPGASLTLVLDRP